MKIRFKVQPYQSEAVDAVIQCFQGQPKVDAVSYQIDPGKRETELFDLAGFRNEALRLTDAEIFKNIQEVQKRQNLVVSKKLDEFTEYSATKRAFVPVKAAYQKAALDACRVHLDVDMETGTGKTYVYIKTILELNKCYGWSKFIVMVPSIAIREGVKKSFEITAEHFRDEYKKSPRFFVYNSRSLHELESFSSNGGIQVMIINSQAFNAKGADNRRIYDELDDFQSRRPIDVIAANRPILILDEPQKLQGDATISALEQFKPLFILRYSATHATQHHCIHRLDAVDAYRQKLVKKIAVRGISVTGRSASSAYLYLDEIVISKDAPRIRLEFDRRTASGAIQRTRALLEKGDNLYERSGELEAYRRYVVGDINAHTNTVEFLNGEVIECGVAIGDPTEDGLRRLQIRETIRAHLDREERLFSQGIKVLSLFFIDEVRKYRDYEQEDTNGEYARIFEEEYAELVSKRLEELDLYPEYSSHLRRIQAGDTHKGYFAIDKQSRLTNPKEKKGESDDESAYDLILKDKERLLSFNEPTRFIFSHSALGEGWDNPNIFTICMLKTTSKETRRRQEIGRGLRLCVNQQGERMDRAEDVHDINVLTVVTSESYKEYVSKLQDEIREALPARAQTVTTAWLTGKTIQTDRGAVTLNAATATQLHRYLIKNDYIDTGDRLTEEWHNALTNGTLAPLPDELLANAAALVELVNSAMSDRAIPQPVDGRKSRTNPLNRTNFDKKEFQDLWARINQHAVYRVEFDSDELIRKSIAALNEKLVVEKLNYRVNHGLQREDMSRESLDDGDAFAESRSHEDFDSSAVTPSAIRYDLVGKVSEATDLTRRTVAEILSQIRPDRFSQFQQNPEGFITVASRLIKEQKASMVIEHLRYTPLEKRYDTQIFTDAQTGNDFSRATNRLRKHVFDYVIADSDVEKNFAHELDIADEITVYAKLPRGFHIPTPVGNYNPDWAIVFNEGTVRHIYFVAETKGTLSSLGLREMEETKIKCARRFFESLQHADVTYDVVTDFNGLMNIVR